MKKNEIKKDLTTAMNRLKQYDYKRILMKEQIRFSGQVVEAVQAA